MTTAKALIERYYDAFNRSDMITFMALLHNDVVHFANQSERVDGKPKFSHFMEHMNFCYRERITNLIVFTTDDGKRAAAEYTVNGMYLNTDQGLPQARGQTYHVSGGAFFDIKDGLIARVSNYYNLQEWLRQVK
jgi:steroid delta-isomerase-like uncharacterized protein